MSVVIFFIFAVCFFLLAGALHYFRLIQQTASYPPKKILKQRAAVFGAGSGIFLAIGIVLLYLH
ncbi:hypothetical protein LRR81_11425 [Metabacillus sp. GX 13764]|uniref:hypothetical protein n=1 Tax=Metabacillus kandeliae TaxID=2900151 RepID=UPI001E5E7278|nr:hypothetical protein [Metabacillus kandeliae]MCD7034856.1 hypothetical protein [Metabacillus kandeliae]